jgi:hypothetical protein
MKCILAWKVQIIVASIFMSMDLVITSGNSAEQTKPPTGKSIVSGRPLSDVADELETLYKTIITYEEALLVDPAELDVMPATFGSRTFMGPKTRTFIAPLVDKADLPGLAGVINAYNKQHGIPSFRVISSQYGLHIVPDLVKNKRGEIAASTPVLDSVISVPFAKRTPWKTFEAFCKAVSYATGIKVDPFCPSLRPSFDQLFTAGEESEFSWGIQTINARMALIDLLSRSATTLSWRLNYAPGADDEFYVLSLSPRLLPSRQQILYDRCGDCPKVHKNLPPASQ